MNNKKSIIGIFAVLIFGGIVFSSFYLLFGEGIKKHFFVLINSSNNLAEVGRSEIVKNLEEVRSPGPLIKDDYSKEGFLTKEGIIEETNRQRKLFEREVLSENEKLNQIAEKKLDNMFKEQYFAHISPNGLGVSDIAKETTYDYLIIGDNLALGTYKDDESVVDAWMNSKGHKENILMERYTEIGVAAKKGIYEEREIWIAVQVFAMPSSACPEIDEDLEKEIKEMEKEVREKEEKLKNLRDEINNIKEKGSELHIKKSEEYNVLLKEQKNLVDELNKLVDKYNKQVEIRNNCIQK